MSEFANTPILERLIRNGYYISRDGMLFSVKSKRHLCEQTCKSGYVYTHLMLDGVRKRVSFHRVVAEAFIPNPNNYPCVNHIDGNKENNYWKNLEWCTHKQNMTHAVNTGLMVGPKKKTIRDMMIVELGKNFKRHDIAEAFGITPERVSQISNRS